jgi:glycine/D-amino acid oxidase-like deaminating enzyme
MTEMNYDVVIIGAGIFGMAKAYHILRNNDNLKVRVVDKAASAVSGSGIMQADAVGRITDALYGGEENAKLFGGKEFKVSRLGLESRDVDKEYLVI